MVERTLTHGMSFGRFAAFAAAMCAIVGLSNLLVQYPVHQLGLQDLLTWGAFTYPVAFLATDLANRLHGPAAARRVVYVGFALGVILSIYLATPRIALASGTAFLMAQLLDVALFNKLRAGAWWRAPLVSSVIGSLLDTAIFFTLAFAALPDLFWPLTVADGFATETVAFFGTALDAPRWVSWAVGDLGAKLATVLLTLLPYRAISVMLARPQAA